MHAPLSVYACAHWWRKSRIQFRVQWIFTKNIAISSDPANEFHDYLHKLALFRFRTLLIPYWSYPMVYGKKGRILKEFFSGSLLSGSEKPLVQACFQQVASLWRHLCLSKRYPRILDRIEEIVISLLLNGNVDPSYKLMGEMMPSFTAYQRGLSCLDATIFSHVHLWPWNGI